MVARPAAGVAYGLYIAAAGQCSLQHGVLITVHRVCCAQAGERPPLVNFLAFVVLLWDWCTLGR